jgi:hypothetical protein
VFDLWILPESSVQYTFGSLAIALPEIARQQYAIASGRVFLIWHSTDGLIVSDYILRRIGDDTTRRQQCCMIA